MIRLSKSSTWTSSACYLHLRHNKSHTWTDDAYYTHVCVPFIQDPSQAQVQRARGHMHITYTWQRHGIGKQEEEVTSKVIPLLPNGRTSCDQLHRVSCDGEHIVCQTRCLSTGSGQLPQCTDLATTPGAHWDDQNLKQKGPEGKDTDVLLKRSVWNTEWLSEVKL